MSQQVEVPAFVTKTTYAVIGEWGNGWYSQGEWDSIDEAYLAACGQRDDCLNVAVVKVNRKLIKANSRAEWNSQDWRALFKVVEARREALKQMSPPQIPTQVTENV
jgi:hypothetical protein